MRRTWRMGVMVTLAVAALVVEPGRPIAQEKVGGILVVANYGGLNAERQKKAFYDPFSAETGVKVVSDLYDDALGDNPVTSYEAVITWDTDQLVAALK